MKILIIEDDPETGPYITKGLEQKGHLVELATTGKDGLFLASSEAYDIMIVDRMLPGLDGLAIVKTIRSTANVTPVLFLTALGSVTDRVDGLESGGDDYLVKPFAFSELVARINALARRPPLDSVKTVLQVADLEMDLLKHKVSRQGQEIDVQPREYRLLEFLMRHAGEVVTRTMLLEHVWDFHFDPHTNVIESHISRLRTKVDKPFDTELIQTVRGAGYLLREQVE